MQLGCSQKHLEITCIKIRRNVSYYRIDQKTRVSVDGDEIEQLESCEDVLDSWWEDTFTM